MSQFILASQSPRRQQLLKQLGYSFEVQAADIDEIAQPNEKPLDFVTRMAIEKAQAVYERVGRGSVLAADTIVVVDDRILGKPVDEADAHAMLTSLSGREHYVMTVCALASEQGVDTCQSISTVRFRQLSDDDIAAYWRTGEPADKAGAYGIQGIAALFISHLDGSYSAVMGLPVFEVGELLARASVRSVLLRG